ncbi:MAG: YggS family pyridoxal phosphate-dependent enzyme [bacterium]
MSDVVANLENVKAQIARVCDKVGRNPEHVTLVAVTKQIDNDRIMEAYNAGQRDFGESYWQEARHKLDALPKDIRWHFVGHLQMNKARYVAGRFALIQSVDKEDLAAELSKRAIAQGINLAILLEVNISDEASKSGVKPEITLEVAGRIAEMPGIELKGLMGIAPIGTTGDLARPCFRKLRSLFDQLPVENRQILSMGMSDDFEVAIEEGSTMVRIGTAIFGSRQTA